VNLRTGKNCRGRRRRAGRMNRMRKWISATDVLSCKSCASCRNYVAPFVPVALFVVNRPGDCKDDTDSSLSCFCGRPTPADRSRYFTIIRNAASNPAWCRTRSKSERIRVNMAKMKVSSVGVSADWSGYSYICANTRKWRFPARQRICSFVLVSSPPWNQNQGRGKTGQK
jgi:hypothetical protein